MRGYLPPEDQKRLQQQHIPSASTIVNSTYALPFHCPVTRFESGWRLPCFTL